MSMLPMLGCGHDSCDLYSEKRKQMGPDFAEVLEGEFRFSEHALGTQSLLSCCAVAVYTNGLAALAHAYPEPTERLSIHQAPYKMQKAFEQRGRASDLMAKVSASSSNAFEIILDELLKNNIKPVASYFHDCGSAMYIPTNVIFDARTENMIILSSEGTIVI